MAIVTGLGVGVEIIFENIRKNTKQKTGKSIACKIDQPYFTETYWVVSIYSRFRWLKGMGDFGAGSSNDSNPLADAQAEGLKLRVGRA